MLFKVQLRVVCGKTENQQFLSIFLFFFGGVGGLLFICSA